MSEEIIVDPHPDDVLSMAIRQRDAARAERDALREAVRKLHALFGAPDSHGVVHAVTTRKTLEAAAQAAVAAPEPHAAAGKTPGQLASIAFRVTAFAEADDTSAVLAWDELPQNYRDGWEAAAQAVLNQAFPGLREQMRLARADRDQLRKQVLDLAAELETSAARTAPSKKTDIENAAAAKLRKAAEPPS